MELKKYFQKGIRVGKLGLIAGFSAFLFNCTNPLEPVDDKTETYIDMYNDYSIGSTHENIIEDNLERPGGLSMYEIPQKSLSKTTEEEVNINGIFTTGPIWKETEDGKRIDLFTSTSAKIYQISGDLESILNGSADISILTEFPLIEYFIDFQPGTSDGLIFDLDGDGVNDIQGYSRPIGLTLDAVLLKDGSVLFSSNVSNKLFKVDLMGQNQVYLEDDRLFGITDMILGSDGKIYAVQVPIHEYVYNADTTSVWAGENTIRPKRVISIDSLKIINEEFIIPSSNYGEQFKIGAYGAIPTDEILRIVENSPIGKTRFGSKFYVSDLLSDVIYKVLPDSLGNMVEVLEENVRFPSSIRVGALGNLFYTTSPLRISPVINDDLDYVTELYFYRPKTGDNYLIHTFDESNFGLEGYSTRATQVQYNGQTYELPTGYNVSSVLSETDTKLRFLLTRSHQGDLWGVIADKF